MDKMIDNMIEIGLPRIALKMQWVELSFNENNDVDVMVIEMMKLQKGESYELVK